MSTREQANSRRDSSLTFPSCARSHSVFIMFRSLYEAREQPSKLYHWTILPLTFLLVEIPWNIISFTMFWIPWNFMTRFTPGNSSRIAFSWFLICVLFQFYWTPFAAAVAAVSANAMIASVAFSFFFSFVVVFCGVVQPPALMPYFWRQWLPPLSPFTYLLESLLANTLLDQPVRCAPGEFSTLRPPTGQSCAQYLSNFSSTLQEPPLGPGYYQEASNGAECNVCQYREGTTFLTSLSAGPVQFRVSHRFRNIGILVAYCAFNFALLAVLFWLRVRPSKAARKSGGKGAAMKLGESKADVAATYPHLETTSDVGAAVQTLVTGRETGEEKMLESGEKEEVKKA